MKQLKLRFKKIVIIYVIIYISITSMTSSLARGYDAQCGEYAGQWARDYVQKYAEKSLYTQKTLGNLKGKAICKWSGGSEGSGTFYGCCTTFVHWIFYNSLGVNLYDYGFDPSSTTAYSNLKGGNQYFDDVTNQTLQSGDILIIRGHAEMHAGNGEHANFGGKHMQIHQECTKMTPGRSQRGAIALRLKSSVEVNPAGSVPVDELEDENLNIYDDNGFIYTGVAKIEGYKGSVPFGKWIIKMLTEILDYMIGILTLGIRIIFVGWTAIIERFVIDGIVNAITGETNKKDENWTEDPANKDEIDREVEEQEVQNAINEKKSEASGDENNPYTYISEGMQGIADIGGKVQLKTTSENNVTVENIVYNKVPILDINFFNFETAGGAILDKDGILYIIKENVAMWYYIFRTIAIALMLIVLLYLGIKMTITTVSEKKAVYKEMLLSWIAGFILVFSINYIMYAVIELNETFVSWIIPKYEDGTEMSLYETVRSKAYELKATSGFTGMFMYMILVYYAIKFLIVYVKRFFTVTVLALMSPFVAVMYSIQKINKNGKGGDIFANWFKDFTYTVILQSIHALIYTVFIQTILDLTQTSLLGIFMSFLFLNFMVKVEPTVKKIFGLTGGKNSAKLSLPAASAMLSSPISKNNPMTKIAKAQGKFIGKTVMKPAGKVVGKIADTADKVIDIAQEKIEEKFGDKLDKVVPGRPVTPEERKKRKEDRKKRNAEIQKGIVIGTKLGKDMFLTFAKGALVIPMLVAEPGFGVQLLTSTLNSEEKLMKSIDQIKDALGKPPKTMKGKKFKFKGFKPKNKKSAYNLMTKLTNLGIEFDIQGGKVIDRATGKDIKYMDSPRFGQNMSELQKAQFGKIKLSELSQEQRRKLLTNLRLKDLTLASGNKTIEEILGQGDMGRLQAYAEILAQAREKEKDLQLEFQSITGRLDEQIAGMEKINPEFAKMLQDKKTKELTETAKLLSKPLAEKDIFTAMQNYQAKAPNFDANTVSSQDVQGIVQEIDAVLAQKGSDIQMSKEFAKKLEKELTDSRRKVQDQNKSITERLKEQAQADVNNPYATSNRNAPKQNAEAEHGNNAGGLSSGTSSANQSKTPGSVGQSSGNSTLDKFAKTDISNQRQSTETVHSNTPRQNSETMHGYSANAPQQNSSTGGESSIERLVKNIKNASKGSSSKKTTKATSRELDFARRLDELERLSQQSEELTGDELYDIDEILRRLKAL